MNAKNAGRKRNLLAPNNTQKDQQTTQKRLKNAQKTLAKLPKTPPKHLLPEAQKLWKALVPEINEMGILTKLDQPNLELLVNNYAMYRDALDNIRQNGIIYTDRFGAPAKNPAVNVVDAMTRNVKSLGASLGLDANARSQLLEAGQSEAIDYKKLMKDMLNGQAN